MQQILKADNSYEQLDEYFKASGAKKVFLVCGSSINGLALGEYFNGIENRLGIKVVRFSDFSPNPLYESVAEGIRIFNAEDCRTIVAVGGGSAMDVAKCIKLFSNMDHTRNYLEQEIVPNDIDLIAVPTTAGTGSEATRFAVIYFNGEKQSISDYNCIPSAVVMDPSALETLPDYQRKATMLDALCHATESFWSVNSTNESQEYSKEAIELILENIPGYIANTPKDNENMLKAANIAGKAINITQTTAGHAMCYKLTTLYGIAHGHAAALCVSKLFPYMVKHMDDCIDTRGTDYPKETFARLAEAYGCSDSMEAAVKFNELLAGLKLDVPRATAEEYEILKNSVNPVRLKNNPVELDINTIDYLYHQILNNENGI